MAKLKKLFYITSDLHFGHYDQNAERGIITFERNQFNNIQAHNAYLVDLLKRWAEKGSEGSELWVLGDFGDPAYLWAIEPFLRKGWITNFIMGNHDKIEDLPEFKEYFDNVYQYPVFLSHKLVLSHEPIAVYEDTINIHGHLHGSKLKDFNHINASIHVANYNPITDKTIAGRFAQLPKYTRRFLYEPYAADYVFTQPKDDVVMDQNGRIDLAASRLLMKLLYTNARVKDDSYNPYVGGLNE